jgi:hypothetical protein
VQTKFLTVFFRMSYSCRICKVPYTQFGPLQRHQLLHHRIWQFRSGEFADWSDEQLDAKVETVRQHIRDGRVRRRNGKKVWNQSGVSSPSTAAPADSSSDEKADIRQTSDAATVTPPSLPPSAAALRRMSMPRRAAGSFQPPSGEASAAADSDWSE